MAVQVESEFSRKGKSLTESGQDVDEFEAPEIKPEEFAEHIANMVANALAATKMFGVVEVRAGVGQVHVLGRVKRELERRFIDQVVLPLLKTMKKSDDCEGFIGKQFLLPGEDDIVKYAWVVSFASNDLRAAASALCRSFEEVVPRVDVTEAPLMGPSVPQSGGRGTGKRGASPIAG